jgi:predicted DsbA family dithiol-disulfide isomerase
MTLYGTIGPMPLLDFLKTLTGRKILVYADFIDPFCYVGWHLLSPLAKERHIELDWRGFEFNPATPPEGLPLSTAGNSDVRPGMWASVQGYARQAGLDFPEPRWVPNTRSAHALLEAAPSGAVKKPLIEAIYQAYFMRQQDISQSEFLIALAKEFGIPQDRAHAALSDQRLASILDARRADAERRAFMGMPGFVYRGRNYFGALSKQAWEKIFLGQSAGRQTPTTR